MTQINGEGALVSEAATEHMQALCMTSLAASLWPLTLVKGR